MPSRCFFACTREGPSGGGRLTGEGGGQVKLDELPAVAEGGDPEQGARGGERRAERFPGVGYDLVALGENVAFSHELFARVERALPGQDGEPPGVDDRDMRYPEVWCRRSGLMRVMATARF